MKKKRNFNRFVAVVLTVSALCCCSALLFACNPPPKADQRKAASQSVASAILSSTDSSWKINLSNEKTAKLDLPGDYVMTNAWTGFLSDILYKSSLQTAKISRITKGLNSEEGKQILKEINSGGTESDPVGVDTYFRLFDSFGFTAVDVSNLFDVAIRAIVNDTTDIVVAAREKLLKISEFDTVKNGAESVRENVNNAIATSGIMAESLNYNLTAANKKALLDAVANAKGATASLISAAYQLSFSSNIGGIIDQIASGAFDQISAEEIGIYINSFTSSFRNLKNSLTVTEVEKLNKAFGLITEKLGSVILPSNIFNQLISYVRTIYIGIDYIPDLCDLVIAAADSAVDDEAFFNLLKIYAADQSKAENEREFLAHNSGIFVSKLLSGALGDLTPLKINEIVERLSVGAGNVYEKNVPFFWLYSLLYVINNADKDVFNSSQDFTDIFSLSISDRDFSSFRAEYKMYRSREGSGNPYPTAKLKSYSYKLIGSFDLVTTAKELSAEWYDQIAIPVGAKLEAEVIRLKPVVMGGLADLFTEFFDNAIPSINELAAMQLVKITDVAGETKLENLYNKLGFGLIFGA